MNKYRKARLLPALTSNVVDVDQANKAHFVGLAPPNAQAWQDAMMRLNMEAGSLKPVTTRFDIQLVCVNSNTVPEVRADEYKTALNAYWESPAFGKSALPKNMAVVVIGTDGKTVSWAWGFTLIPTGNGITWSDLQNFAPGTAFTPQALIGEPTAQVAPGRIGNGECDYCPDPGGTGDDPHSGLASLCAAAHDRSACRFRWLSVFGG